MNKNIFASKVTRWTSGYLCRDQKWQLNSGLAQIQRLELGWISLSCIFAKAVVDQTRTSAKFYLRVHFNRSIPTILLNLDFNLHLRVDQRMKAAVFIFDWESFFIVCSCSRREGLEIRRFTPTLEDDCGLELWRGWSGRLDRLTVDFEVRPPTGDSGGSSSSEKVLLKGQQASIKLLCFTMLLRQDFRHCVFRMKKWLTLFPYSFLVGL